MNDEIDIRFNNIETRLSKLDILDSYIGRVDKKLTYLLDSLESLILSNATLTDSFREFKLINMKIGKSNGQ